jgi:hypothetical protein
MLWGKFKGEAIEDLPDSFCLYWVNQLPIFVQMIRAMTRVLVARGLLFEEVDISITWKPARHARRSPRRLDEPHFYRDAGGSWVYGIPRDHWTDTPPSGVPPSDEPLTVAECLAVKVPTGIPSVETLIRNALERVMGGGGGTQIAGESGA